MASLKRVMITFPFSTWPLARQSSGESCKWGNCEFFINTPLSECDAWIVLEDLLGLQSTRCPKDNVLLIAWEHHEFRSYDHRYVNQFPAVLTCNDLIRHPNKQTSQLGFPWHAGVDRRLNLSNFGLDELSRMEMPAKTKSLATVCSEKKITPGHKLRYALVDTLRQKLGQRMDVYGKTFQPIDDKWDAIWPYHYQLVIENGSVDHWWTEKIADAYLGYSYPIYWGCPNLESYFPAESFIRLDVEDIPRSLARVQEIIAHPPTSTQVAAMHEARRLVLEEYNLFALLEKWVNATSGGELATVTLRPEAHHVPPRSPSFLSQAMSTINRMIQSGVPR